MTRHATTSVQLLAALCAIAMGAHTARAQSTETFFRGVRVFDGGRALDATNVLVRDGRIAAIGAKVTAPAGATVVDGTGKTLIPGLIDAHTHTWGDAPRTALQFGVTTELDMFTDPNAAVAMRAEQVAGKASGRADVFSAGTLVTAPKGHGTEYGTPIPTIDNPESAQAFVDARIAEGSDWIKIVYDDGHTYGLKYATLSEATLRAVIAAAHKRGKLAVVHIGDLASARGAIDAGADGLVHLFVDKEPDAEFGRFMAAHHAFAIPTMTVLMSITGVGGGATLVDDPRIAPYLSRMDVTMLKQGFPKRPGVAPTMFAAAEQTVRQLKAAGVPILAGTDASNPGTSHGAALHRELELLVNAGLTPAEALTAATSAPAAAFKLAGRGRIAAGSRADLVLVNGDPMRDIAATRDIAGVWKGGVAVDRAAFAAAIAEDRAALNRLPKGAESGLVSDFESGTLSASFGAGWMNSTDEQAGGKSSATSAVADSGAHGSAKALVVSGTISGAVPFAWAGVMFSPGSAVFSPANLSSKKEVRFWAKGDGKTYRVMIFAESKGYNPLTQTFVAGPEWKEYSIPLSAFGGIDGHDVMALIFAGGPTPGTFAFRIDDVRIQ